MLFNQLVYCRLKSDHKSLASYEIADEIEVSPDQKSILVSIKPNQEFSNKETLDAYVVAQNFQNALEDDQCAPSRCQILANVQTVEATSPKELLIKVKEPQPNFDSILNFSLLHPSNFSKSASEYLAEAPTCGFYRPKLNPSSTKLLKNPFIDNTLTGQIIFKPFNNEIAKNKALANQDIDVLVTSRPYFHMNTTIKTGSSFVKKRLNYLESVQLNIMPRKAGLKNVDMVMTLLKTVEPKNIHTYLYTGKRSSTDKLRLGLLNSRLDSLGYKLKNSEEYRFSMEFISSVKENDIIIAKALSAEWAKLDLFLKIKILDQTNSLIPEKQRRFSDFWLSYQPQPLANQTKDLIISAPFGPEDLDPMNQSLQAGSPIKVHLWDRELFFVFDQKKKNLLSLLPIK